MIFGGRRLPLELREELEHLAGLDVSDFGGGRKLFGKLVEIECLVRLGRLSEGHHTLVFSDDGPERLLGCGDIGALQFVAFVAQQALSLRKGGAGGGVGTQCTKDTLPLVHQSCVVSSR